MLTAALDIGYEFIARSLTGASQDAIGGKVGGIGGTFESVGERPRVAFEHLKQGHQNLRGVG
jgi:hypothetical protein